LEREEGRLKWVSGEAMASPVRKYVSLQAGKFKDNTAKQQRNREKEGRGSGEAGK